MVREAAREVSESESAQLSGIEGDFIAVTVAKVCCIILVYGVEFITKLILSL